YNVIPDEWQNFAQNSDRERTTANAVTGLELGAQVVELATRASKEYAFTANGVLPNETEGIIGPFPVAEIEEEAVKASANLTASIAAYIQFASAQATEAMAKGLENAQKLSNLDLEDLLQNYEYRDELKWTTLETQSHLQSQYARLAELQSQIEVVQQSLQKVQ